MFISGFILNVGIPFYTVPADKNNTTNPKTHALDSSFISSTGQQNRQHDENRPGSDAIHDEKFDLKLEKSNILMLGPTGSGRFDTLTNIFFLNHFVFDRQNTFGTNCGQMSRCSICNL